MLKGINKVIAVSIIGLTVALGGISLWASLGKGALATSISVLCGLSLLALIIIFYKILFVKLEKHHETYVETLDKISTNMMLTDADYQITHINKSLNKLFKDSEPTLKSELPEFKLSQLVGSSLGLFHTGSSYQNTIIQNLKSTHKASIKIGQKRFDLISSPIFDDTKHIVAVVIEWQDSSLELLEEQIVTILKNASDGDLTSSIDTTSLEGINHSIADNLNQFLSKSKNIIDDVIDVMDNVSNGNLTETIKTDKYQGIFEALGNKVNDAEDKLNSSLARIREATNSVAHGVTEIAQGNVDLQSQASTLEETAASMVEMSTGVKENSEQSQEAAKLSDQAYQKAIEGGNIVSQVVSAMDAIDESSKKIDDIISVIDEIAFQTNLLALNAAVEAARAGDQGSGFAVVASEVRNLAQRSASSAKEIKDLIKNSSEKVDEGTTLAKRSGDSLEEIVSVVANVNEAVKLISNSCTEQASGITEINDAVSNLDGMTQQNSALVEEITSASEQMRSQTSKLQDQVASFKIVGASEPMSPAPSVIIHHHEPSPVVKPVIHEVRDDKPISLSNEASPTTIQSSPAPEKPAATPAPAANTSVMEEDDDEEWESF